MRLPRPRDPSERLWRGGEPASPQRSSPGLVLGAALGVFAALYPAVLPARLLIAFLSGLFAGSALPALLLRCPRCGARLLPGTRFCGRCGSPMDRP